VAYCTIEKLVSRFGEAELLRIADRDHDDKIDASVVQEALDDASVEIDAYIGTRYSTPMDPAPSLLERLCADIARYRLYDENPLEEVDNRYKQAVATLRDISSGRASLKDPNADIASGDVLVTHTDEDRLFTMDSMRGF
jgi:phage gp36-like protein